MKQESKKYHDTKPGSIQDTVMQMQVNEQKSVTIRVKELSALIETYLAKGGVIHNLSPVIAEMKQTQEGGPGSGPQAKSNTQTKKKPTYLPPVKRPVAKRPKGGLFNGEEVLPLQAVREFIDTYNRFFLTNYRAEEFIIKG
jgi:hypothetical protein